MGSMLQIFLMFMGTYVYMEAVYHLGCFGFVGFQPIIAVPVWIAWSALASFFMGFLRKKSNKIIYIFAFIDPNAYGTIFNGTLTGYEFIINLLVTIIMSVSVVATIFSGWEYIKGGKDLFKNSM